MSFEEFWSIDKILEISIEDAGLLNRFKHSFCFSSISSKWFCSHHCLFVFAAEHDSFFVQIVWQRNANHFNFRAVDRSFYTCGGECYIIILGKLLCAFFFARVDGDNLVFASVSLKGVSVKSSDEA